MACPTDSRQQPLFAVRRFLPRPYQTGSFFDVLERFGSLIIKAEDFPRVSHEAGGVPGFCVVLKSKLVLLQRKHGWSDEETVLRARTATWAPNLQRATSLMAFSPSEVTDFQKTVTAR